MAVQTPQKQTPSPVEIGNWQAGRENARQQYLRTTAANDYNRANTQVARGMDLANFGRQGQQQRQTFDDPYISRGIFNSGIRKQGLQNWQSQRTADQLGMDLQYGAAMGNYNIADQNARAAYEDYFYNSLAQQAGRQADLASQIRGII